MKIKSLFLIFLLFTSTVYSQWYASLTNPNVSVVLTHPPKLMLKIDRIAFYPDYKNSSRELCDYLMTHFVNERSIDIIDREHLNQILMEQNLSISGRIDPATSAKLGKLLGSAAFVFVKVYRDKHEKKHLTEKYKSDGKEKIKYISKINVSFKVSLQTTDLTTGRIFQANIIEKSKDAQNTKYEDGYPEFPSVENLREQMIKEVVTEVSTYFLNWKEHLSPVFFNDKICGMKEAYNALDSGSLEEATRLSIKTLECVKSNHSIKAKHKSRAYYNLGMCYFLDKKYDQAAELFRKAYSIKDYGMYKDAANNSLRAKQVEEDLLKVEEMAPLNSENEQQEMIEETNEPESTQVQDTDTDTESIESKLEKLKRLFDKGLITKEEYDKKRNELLSKL